MDVIVVTGHNAYTLEYEHKNGWNVEMFRERYCEVLERFDYIVGDWGYNQLRLRGFYRDGHPRATKETTISSLVDYLNEYCNFGCAYFVLRKTDVKSAPAESVASAHGGGDAAAQAAETVAAVVSANGMLMRWPLKERAGGPVRMPGAAAVARAAAEAERRQAQTAGAKGTEGRSGSSYAHAPAPSESGYGGKSGQRGGAERRSNGGSSYTGQADGRSGGRSGHGGHSQGNRGPRQHHYDRHPGGGTPTRSGGGYPRQASPDASRPAPSESVRAAEAGGQKADAAKSGGRYPGKNRRKNRFGSKPNRPDSAHAPLDGGSLGKPPGD